MADTNSTRMAEEKSRYKSWFSSIISSQTLRKPEDSNRDSPAPQPGPSDYTTTRNNSFPNSLSSVEPPQVSAFKFTESPQVIPPPQSDEEAPVSANPPTKADSQPLEDIPEEQKPEEHEMLASTRPTTPPPRDEAPNVDTPRLRSKLISEASIPSPFSISLPENQPSIRIDCGIGEYLKMQQQIASTSKFPGEQANAYRIEFDQDFEGLDDSSLWGSLMTSRRRQQLGWPAIPNPTAQSEPYGSPSDNAIPSKRFQDTDAHRGTNAGPWDRDSLMPPVSNMPMGSPSELLDREPPFDLSSQARFPEPQGTAQSPKMVDKTFGYVGFYNTEKPTCSLNLVCYRSNACDLQQVQCINRPKFIGESFEETIKANPHLVYNDVQFFQEIRRLFTTQMCGFFRRYFSLKTLREFRILSYTPTTRPRAIPFDDFVLQEMMFAYRNPDRLESKDDWIRWAFRLRSRNKRHAIEFVEGWDTTRIAIAGTIPSLSSCLVGILWAAIGGDTQTAFTVASFILTSSSVILALLAILSSIESSRRTTT